MEGSVLRHILVPSLMVLCISACSASENRMNQNASESGLQPVSQERGRAQLNPQPTRGYEITLRIEDAPGSFAMAEGSAQYDVVNEDQCGHINATSGTAERITSLEPVALTKVGEGEYRGTVFLDRLLDADYYGRGVCRWELTAASVVLRATGAESETRFQPTIDARQILAGEAVTLYFWKGGYPRSDMDNYPDSGMDSPEKFRADIRNELFTMTLKAQGPQP